jgi:cytoskeletal protein CcmA (bactofilin family)
LTISPLAAQFLRTTSSRRTFFSRRTELAWSRPRARISREVPVSLLGKAPTPAPSPETPSRRFTDAVDPNATVIGPGTQVKGELVAEGPVELAGLLDGDARVSAHLRVRPGARVTGRLEAKSVVVEGEVTGASVAAERIEIGATARVSSSIQARVVAIAEGAFFEGEVRMDATGAPGTPITFTEKRR